MKTIIWTKKQARDFMVGYHFINCETLNGHDGIKTVFERLRTIQFDPLDVVGKNPDLVLQSRVKDYRKSQVFDALYDKRYLIDGWDKMMSIYLTEDFSSMQKMRSWRAEGEINTLKNRLQIDALGYQQEVLDILKNGPKSSSEIRIGDSTKRVWGQTKASSATLDYLFHIGKVGVRNRKSTQKKYDLIENLLDSKLLVSNNMSDEEFTEFILYRRICAMGLVWNKNGVHWSAPFISRTSNRTKYLKLLLEKERITKVIIEGINEEFYVPTLFADKTFAIEDKISFIAPLDNLIWDRDLVETLFNFKYRWEVYTPIIKREYGYYVLPILKGSEFVGRIEFLKHRNNEPLSIKQVWWESKPYKVMLNKAIKEFKLYLGAKETN